MDPLSISVAAVGLAQLALDTSKSIYTFIQATKTTDQQVSRLQNRAESLSQILNGLAQTLKTPHLVHPSNESPDTWKSVSDSVDSCRSTVFQLYTKVKSVEKPKAGIKQVWRQVKLNLMEDDVIKILSDMDTCSVNLQLSLAIVNLLINASSPTAIVQENAARFDNLERMVLAIGERLEHPANQLATNMNNNLDNVRFDENTVGLMRSATSVISSASTVAMRSELGDAPDIQEDRPAFEHLGTSIDENHPVATNSTSGSEIGGPLDDARKEQIQQWIQRSPNIDEVSEPASDSSEIHGQSFAFSVTSPSPELEINVPMKEIFEESSDEDFDFQVAQNLFSRGTARFKNDEFDAALTVIEHGLEEAQHLITRKQEALNIKDMRLKLAICYHRVGDFTAAEEIFLSIVKEPIRNNEDAERVFSASHSLSCLHLQKRNFDAAEAHCRQALTGRRKTRSIGKTHADYLSSLRLLALISWAKGDKIHAEACAELLPPDMKLLDSDFDQIINAEFKALSRELEQHSITGSSEATHDTSLAVASDRKNIHSGQLRSSDSATNSRNPEISASSTEDIPSVVQQSSKSSYVTAHGANIGTADPSSPGPEVSGQSATGQGGDLEEMNSKDSEISATSLNGTQSGPEYPFSLSTDALKDLRKPSEAKGVASIAPLQPGKVLSRTQKKEMKTQGLKAINDILSQHVALDEASLELRSADDQRLAAHREIADIKFFKGTASKIRLLQACENGELHIVNALVQRGVDVNWRGLAPIISFGRTSLSPNLVGKRPLVAAAGNGHVEICARLIAASADVDGDSSDHFRSSPLRETILKNPRRASQVCQLLLNHGARNRNDGLSLAAVRGNLTLCALFLSNGADANKNADLGQPLYLAIHNGNFEICRLLVLNGAKVKENIVHLISPLASTVRKSNIEICRLLASAGASWKCVTDIGRNALMLAAEKGNVEMCEYFLTQGLGIDANDNSGNTALILAAKGGYLKTCKLLLARGANAQLYNKQWQSAFDRSTNEDVRRALRDHEENQAKVSLSSEEL